MTVGNFIWQINSQRGLNLNQSDFDHNQSYVTLEDTFQAENTLWWAGLTGREPEFIFSKGMRGLGWGEFTAKQLKKRLIKEYGVQLVDWYITPARLDAEFKLARRPVCTYPHIWHDPEKTFTKELNFLISFGMEIGGDEVYSIYVRKKDRGKFIDHFTDSGDISLSSLLSDTKLTTRLITGVIYEHPFDKALLQKNDGSWVVKEEFNRQIQLMVASDNVQLVKMLQNKRIDYIFDQLVNTEHFVKAGLSEKNFVKLTYKRNSILSYKDPQMTTTSVRCNLHPFNFKLLPVLNNIIRNERSAFTTMGKNQHRSKLEYGYNFIPSWHTTLNGRMDKMLHSGEIDWWYESYFLPLFPPGVFSSSLSAINAKEGENEKKLLSLENKVNKSQPYIASRAKRVKEFKVGNRLYVLPYSVSGDDDNQYTSREHLVPWNLNVYLGLEVKDLYSNSHYKDYIIPEEKDESIKELVLSAFSFTYAEIKKIITSYPKLTSLKIVAPKYNQRSKFERLIPPSLTQFALVAAKIDGNILRRKLKNTNLEYLDLSGSEVNDDDDLLEILSDHRKTLKFLNLSRIGYLVQKSFWQKFGHIKFEKLETLILAENKIIGNKTGKELVKRIPLTLRHLDLRGNRLFPDHFKTIFNRCKGLKTLYVSRSFLAGSGELAQLPSDVDELIISDNGINDDDLKKLNLNKHLKRLDISKNKIGDSGFAYLGEKISAGLQEISLSHNNNSSDGIFELFFEHIKGQTVRARPWVKDIKSADLSTSRLNDRFLNEFVKWNTSIERLDIANNILSDGSVAAMQKLSNLKKLSITMNFFSRDGFNELLRSSAFAGIEELYISYSPEISVAELAKWLPKNLRILDIANNHASEKDMDNLLSDLPNSLIELNIQGNQVSWQSLNQFLAKNPQNLTKLGISVDRFNSEEFVHFINGLPNSLTTLTAYGGHFKESVKRPRYPVDLLYVNFGGIGWNDSFSSPILESIPSFVYELNFNNSDLGAKSMSILSKFANDIPYLLYTFNDRQEAIPIPNLFLMSFGNIALANVFQALASGVDFNAIRFIDDKVNPMKDLNYLFRKYPQREGKYIKLLFLIGSGFTDEISELVSQYDLSMVKEISLEGTRLTGKGIINFLKSLSSDVYHISLRNSNMQYDDVDGIIKHLPPELLKLSISGNNIGERGYQLFRDWKERQENKLGFEIVLEE